MLPTIQPDDQPMPHASEVDNKWSNRMLPSELPPLQPSTTQQKPQPTFDLGYVPPQRTCVLVRHRHGLRAIGKQTIANRLPLPLFAGAVEARSDEGEGRAACPPLTRLARPADLGPLFAAQARKRGRGEFLTGNHP
jgi:hypothetical protein